MKEKPSPRQQAQDAIVSFLQLRRRTFNAPYGVVTGMKPFGRGTFGQARYLDATLTIVSPKCILFEGYGSVADRIPRKFGSVGELIRSFVDVFHLQEEGHIISDGEEIHIV